MTAAPRVLIATEPRMRPDAIVTQLDMGLGEVEQVLASLRQASPGSKVVVRSLWDNPRYLEAISRTGIDVLLHKSSPAEELVAAVEAASLDPGGQNDVVSLPNALLEGAGGERPHGLTRRELEIVVLAARGLSNRQIGEELFTSEATVKRHLANVYAKAGVRSRKETVRKAVAEEWKGTHEITGAGDQED